MFPIIKRILNSPSSFWILLAIPAPALLADISERNRYYAEIMYESGLLSVQLMVLALSLTPLLGLLNWWRPARAVIRWLIQRRRAIGVASFGYAALHTFFYVRQMGSLELVVLDLSEKELAIGWVAFAILLALGLTSNTFSLRLLGKRWKQLQRWAYGAALLTALHWFWVNQFLNELLIWFLPLILLQTIRIMRKSSMN